jgi:GTP cyclohydrolase FolE2
MRLSEYMVQVVLHTGCPCALSIADIRARLRTEDTVLHRIIRVLMPAHH